jgi:tetratricopeptide (TPR) repeat protein
MTTFKQHSATPEETTLHRLYESGEFQQALHLLDGSDLLPTLEKLPDDPGLTDTALVVANLYRELGRFSESESFYVQALANLTHDPGKDHPDYAGALAELAQLQRRQGRYHRALAQLEQARDIHEAVAVPDPIAHARCLRALAEVYDDLDRRRDAEASLGHARGLLERAGAPPAEMAGLLLDEVWLLFRLRGSTDSLRCARRALEIYRARLGDDHPATLDAGFRLGRLLISVCRLGEAAPLIERAAAARSQRFGDASPRAALDLQILARLRLYQGETREAEKLARRSLDGVRDALGDGHPEVADVYRELARVLNARRQWAEAREALEQALGLVQAALGEGHSRVAEIEWELAHLDLAMGHHRDAEERLRGSLERLDRHPDDVRFEQVCGNLALAQFLLRAGLLDEAESLAARARELTGQLPGPDPALFGEALLLLGQARSARGDFGTARKLLDEARQALRDLPEHYPAVMEVDVARAGLAEVEGDPAGAVRLAREAVRRIEDEGGERSPWLPGALCFLAERLLRSGDCVAAEQAYERALALQCRRCGADDPDLAGILRGLAHLHLARGNVAAAEVRLRRALQLRTDGLGERHPDTAESLHDLAALLHQVGDLLGAEVLFRRALEIRRDCLGAGRPETLASQHGLALVLAGRGETIEAAGLLEKALALTGPDHPNRAPLQQSLAAVCDVRGERARALELLLGVLADEERRFGTQHPALIPVLVELGRVQVGLGDYLAARSLQERISAIRAAFPIPDPPGQACDLVNLAELHQLLGDGERAWPLARQALETARRHLPARAPELVGYLTQLARACQTRRDFAAARRHFREAMGLVLESGGSRHPLVPALWADLAGVEVARGKPRAATPLYERAADLFRSAVGEDHPDHAAARRVLGLHLQTQGEHGRAEKELARYLEISRRSFGAEHPLVLLAHQTLAELRRLHGDLPGAEAEHRQALGLLRRSELSHDALHAGLLHGLAVVVRQQGRLDEAAALLRDVLEIDRASTGEEGLGPLDALLELARVEAARGKGGAALEGFRRVLAAQERLVPAYACLPPGPVRDGLLAGPWRLTEALLTLALSDREAAGPALEAVLRWKGLCSADLALEGRARLRRRHPELTKEIDGLFDLGMQIGGRLSRGAGQEGLQLHQDLLRRWGEAREPLEERVSAAVPPVARLRALRGVGVADVRKALPPCTTLVELVRFQPRDFAAECAGEDKPRPPHYVALRACGGEEAVALIDLGAAADLEHRGGAEQLRRALAGQLTGQALIVAADGRLAGAAFRRCGLGGSVRELGSGRELVIPQAPVRRGWLTRLRACLQG